MPWDGVALTKQAYDTITTIKAEDLKRLMKKRIEEGFEDQPEPEE